MNCQELETACRLGLAVVNVIFPRRRIQPDPVEAADPPRRAGVKIRQPGLVALAAAFGRERVSGRLARALGRSWPSPGAPGPSIVDVPVDYENAKLTRGSGSSSVRSEPEPKAPPNGRAADARRGSRIRRPAPCLKDVAIPGRRLPDARYRRSRSIAGPTRIVASVTSAESAANAAQGSAYESQHTSSSPNAAGPPASRPRWRRTPPPAEQAGAREPPRLRAHDEEDSDPAVGSKPGGKGQRAGGERSGDEPDRIRREGRGADSAGECQHTDRRSASQRSLGRAEHEP